VGLRESWEKEGEDGAVEPGEFGRERLCMGLMLVGSSECESWECERDMFGEVDAEFEKAYAEREGRREL